MAYFFIRGEGIYLPTERLQKLQREVAGSAVEYARSFLDEKKGAAIDKKIAEHLESIAIDNPQEFQNEWLSIRLYGEQAVDNTFWIIADWIEHTGRGSLVDFRSAEQKISQSHSGEDIQNPYGNYFGINLNAKEGILKPSKTLAKIHIDAESVDKIMGQFPNFKIYTSSFDIQFGEYVVILPSVHSS